MHKEYHNINPDCPGCGKKEGAFMGSTAWGHDVSCCSDECGEKIRKVLEENIGTKKYKNEMKKYRDSYEKLLKLKYNNISVMGFRDRIGEGL